MPTYDYRCDDCGHFFEEFQSMKDAKLTKCPECGKETLKRLIGAGSGLIFKGTGFYLTDYKNKPAESASSTTKNTTVKDKEKTEPSETKADVKVSSKPTSENTSSKSDTKLTEKKSAPSKTD
ncbi:MAG TPA: zinc ribbon domain-containing protein [Ignavibacteria bacterium]|nr:zinc ribbon domain-containing protein [Ignavibacteria bacterium]HQY53277.1 zinc ribbon domain-containing protein [Ignavibacteria bacterium]HRB01089.1 zinc ribbon domain-containing protein [Ignavibacteria bacterium]